MAYKGESVNIPLGEYGLLTDIASGKAPESSLTLARNICFTNGCVEKAPGGIKWNDVALPAGIVALHYWQPSLVQERMIAVTETGSIYKGRDREFGTAINTGLGTLNPNCVFAEGGAEVAGRTKKLFLFTAGKTLPYVLEGDGTTFEPISGPSTDWAGTNFPKFGVVHRNRLWAFAGQIGYASATDDHENFASDNLVDPIYPGEGGELLGAYVFKGRLFAFKDGGFVYLLNDLAADSSEYYWEKIASNFGLSAPNGIDEVLNNLYAGNSTGTITDYAASEKLGSVEASDLIQNLLFENHLRGNASKVGVPYQHLLYYAEKKMLFATYRSAYYTYNDMLIMIDFSSGQPRPSYWIKGSPQCMALYKDVNQIERPMYGNKDGFVILMDREDRLEGGVAYRGEFQTVHTDLSFANPKFKHREKHFDHLAVNYIPESTGNLMCDYYVDGRFVETLTFQLIQYDESKLGDLLLGTDRLSQLSPETCVRPLAASGRTFSARFYNEGSNQSFKIPSITVFFRPGGDKATQQE